MSLLERAKNLRQRPGTGSGDPDIVFDAASGISEEDQRDILAQIEDLSRKNRISAAPETLKVRARKRGVLFPAVVNLAAFVLLASGLLSLSSFFRQSDSELRKKTPEIRSAEGRLIQEIKKETQALIKGKEEEIASIMTRLGEIDRERRDLQANMNSRVRQREEELRKALERELQEERSRLASQGLTEAVIAQRMKKFEEEKNAQFKAELAAFKTRVEAELMASESNLRSLQTDFQERLVALNKEREAILADSRRREEALRSQFDERLRALSSADADSRQKLAQAQTELRRLGEQKEKAALTETQIRGFYTAVGNHLREGRLPEARETLVSLKSFLNDPSIMAVPEIQERRALDIAVADMLTSMIDENIRKTRESLSISQALGAEPILEEIRKTVKEADDARRRGDIPGAEKLYNAALSRIPEVLASHEYFIRREADKEESRRKTAEEALQRADAQFTAGNYRDAWNAYTAVLDFLPLPGGAARASSGNIRQSGYEVVAAERRDPEARAADAATIAALRAEKAASEAQLRKQNTDLRTEYEGRIGAMEAELRTLRQRPAAAASEPQAVPAAAQQELRRLAAVEADINRAKSSYSDYAAREDGIIRAKGDAGIVETKLLLDTFLASESIRGMFPGLDGRIKRFDRAFQAAGAGDALLQASDIAFRLSSFRTNAERSRYLGEELARRGQDPAMREYLETLKEFTR